LRLVRWLRKAVAVMEPQTRISTRTPSAPAVGPLSLVVLGADQLVTHPLPASGQLTLGRSPKCDLPIDEKSISRQHAILRIGSEITIEDLASANGTRVGGVAIRPHTPTVIRQGESVELGETSILIQRRPLAYAPRRLWPHGYFEGRFEDECARGQEPFAVMFVHCDGKPSLDTVCAALADVIRPIDVAGEYGAGEYEVLLVDTGPEVAETRAQALVAALSRRSVAARAGVACFPRDGRTPEELLGAAAQRARPRVVAPAVAPTGVVVEDRAMIQLRKVIERVASGQLSVLLLGETGVGKEILAEHVHRSSPRGKKPFLKLNCAAMTESLLESELFGHEKGSFTGAAATKLGLLETAQGGTVFLDEIGEMSPAIQVKLLRVLEERKVMRVGGLKPIPIDVRFVAATNRDLEHEIAAGRFRQDLYYRLAGISLVIPPLRERVDEIVPLARAFVATASSQAGHAPPRFDASALELLASYSWPGNIRELRNVVERATLLTTDGVIRPEHLPLEKMRATFAPSPTPDGKRQVAGLEAFYPGDSERERIISTLEQCRGNQTKAARILGMSRRTLIYRLERYGLPRPRKAK
jgi:two-component system, NtrC family, response regulator AtoC